jgi:hypothetical protein
MQSETFSLIGRARQKLEHEATRNDPDVRRVLGHARLLDSLFSELSTVIKPTWNESDAQDEHPEAVEGSTSTKTGCGAEHVDKSEPEAGSDSSSDSDSDSDLDWLDSSVDSDTDSDDSHGDPDSDSDSNSDSDSDSESDPNPGLEWHPYHYGAELERAARDWAQMQCSATAKPIAVGGQLPQVRVREDEIES